MTSRCSACNHRTRCVPPDGPSPCEILLIGERPGWWEDNIFNRPFTGDSGRELNDNYIRLAGLDRDMVRITNTVRCRSFDTNRKPSLAEISSCAGHFMPQEVRETNPAIIVLMGGTACSMVSDLPIDLEKEHGIPRWQGEGNRYFGESWSGWVVPMYHPAAGMHQTSLMIPLLEDWKNLGDWLKGEWELPRPIAEVKKMVRLTTAAEVSDAIQFRSSPLYRFLPLDTESDEGRPFSIQFSPNPEEGCMVLVQDREAMDMVGCGISWEWDNRLALHHALHDLDELERHYGWTGIEVIDTMVEAYHLGNLPQALKRLTYRLTGVRMTSYDDVVVPASKDALTDWLAEAIVFVSSNWQMERTKQLKTKLKIEQIRHPAEAVLRRVMRFSSDSESEYDPWQEPKKLGTEDEEVRLLGREWLEGVEAGVGRMPRKSIIHASLPKAIEYGCSDAIYTGHCMVRLAERRKQQQAVWEVDEKDVDEVLK